MLYRKCRHCGRTEFLDENDFSTHWRKCAYGRARKEFPWAEDIQLKSLASGKAMEENYLRLKLIVARAVEAAQGETSSRETWDQLKAAQEELKGTQPLRRDQRDELWQMLQQGFATLKKRREEYRQQKQREWEERQRQREQRQKEWKQRLREAIEHKKATVARLEESFQRDTQYQSDLERKRTNIRPGRRADDIRRDLDRRINQVAARRIDKARKINELNSSIEDMQLKLYHR